MSLQVPVSARDYGFTHDHSAGIHTSRTMMLTELRLLLAACDVSATLEEYRTAVVAENMLLKETLVTRKNTFGKLRMLYALDKRVLLFRTLRDLWDADVQAQPQLAFLCASARDPILKATADMILALPVGETVTPAMMTEAVQTYFPERYRPKTLKSIGKNVIGRTPLSGERA